VHDHGARLVISPKYQASLPSASPQGSARSTRREILAMSLVEKLPVLFEFDHSFSQVASVGQFSGEGASGASDRL